MVSGVQRAMRLKAIMDLLKTTPGGLTTLELAERFEVSERTIYHDLGDLQGEPFYLPLELVTVWRVMKLD